MGNYSIVVQTIHLENITTKLFCLLVLSAGNYTQNFRHAGQNTEPSQCYSACNIKPVTIVPRKTMKRYEKIEYDGHIFFIEYQIRKEHEGAIH